MASPTFDDSTAREMAVREMATREMAAREMAARDMVAQEMTASREMAARQMAARDMAAIEMTASREMAAKEMAAKEMAARDMAAREMTASREMAAREMAAKEMAAKEMAAREMASREMAVAYPPRVIAPVYSESAHNAMASPTFSESTHSDTPRSPPAPNAASEGITSPVFNDSGVYGATNASSPQVNESTNEPKSPVESDANGVEGTAQEVSDGKSTWGLSEELRSAYLAYGDVFLTKKPRIRRELTIEDKVRVIERSWSGLSERQIAKEFNISKTAVHTALMREKEILTEYISGGGNRKRKARSTNTLVDDKVWEWYQNLVMRNLPVSGAMIQRKARQIAEVNGLDHFKGSNGWLDSFKRRHHIGPADSHHSSITAYMQPLFNRLAGKQEIDLSFLDREDLTNKNDLFDSKSNENSMNEGEDNDDDNADDSQPGLSGGESSGVPDAGDSSADPHAVLLAMLQQKKPPLRPRARSGRPKATSQKVKNEFGLPLLASLVSYQQYLKEGGSDDDKTTPTTKRRRTTRIPAAAKAEAQDDSASETSPDSKFKFSPPMKKTLNHLRKLHTKKTAKEMSVARELAAMAMRHTPPQDQLVGQLTHAVHRFCIDSIKYKNHLEIRGELNVVYDDNNFTAKFNDNFFRSGHGFMRAPADKKDIGTKTGEMNKKMNRGSSPGKTQTKQSRKSGATKVPRKKSVESPMHAALLQEVKRAASAMGEKDHGRELPQPTTGQLHQVLPEIAISAMSNALHMLQQEGATQTGNVSVEVQAQLGKAATALQDELGVLQGAHGQSVSHPAVRHISTILTQLNQPTDVTSLQSLLLQITTMDDSSIEIPLPPIARPKLHPGGNLTSMSAQVNPYSRSAMPESRPDPMSIVTSSGHCSSIHNLSQLPPMGLDTMPRMSHPVNTLAATHNLPPAVSSQLYDLSQGHGFNSGNSQHLPPGNQLQTLHGLQEPIASQPHRSALTPLMSPLSHSNYPLASLAAHGLPPMSPFPGIPLRHSTPHHGLPSEYNPRS